MCPLVNALAEQALLVKGVKGPDRWIACVCEPPKSEQRFCPWWNIYFYFSRGIPGITRLEE